jgi:ferrous iron transport protein A
MGLTPGTEFTVVRLAPLGDPIEIVVRGYSVSLRKNEAEMLQVERL